MPSLGARLLASEPARTGSMVWIYQVVTVCGESHTLEKGFISTSYSPRGGPFLIFVKRRTHSSHHGALESLLRPILEGQLAAFKEASRQQLLVGRILMLSSGAKHKIKRACCQHAGPLGLSGW